LPFLSNKQNAGGRATLSAAMMAYWANFARNGIPANGGQTALP
jgi:hypothetical protein